MAIAPSCHVRSADLIEIIRARRWALAGKRNKYRSFVEALGEAYVVVLGEASHGTHEFYRWRADITQKLIAEHGFTAVAVEADWADAYRVNRFVRGESDDKDSIQSLSGFERFPSWMWRNADVALFVEWLRNYNHSRPVGEHAGFYGLDLYSLNSSMRQVLKCLDPVDPEAAFRVRARHACFDRSSGEASRHSYAATATLSSAIQNDLVTQLTERLRRAPEQLRKEGVLLVDECFFEEENPALMAQAEEYYSTLFLGRVDAWNMRETHLAATLTNLIEFLGRTRPNPRVVVWAHNTHAGDSRATEMGGHQELSLGQFARDRFGSAATLVGFTTHTGLVTAASVWGGPSQRHDVVPSIAGSYERLFHETELGDFIAPFKLDAELSAALISGRLERGIGAVYTPESERKSHYFHARLPDQFDFVVHLNETSAVQPLDAPGMAEFSGELDENVIV
jgi:erythromycin esterase-like protein